MICIWRVFWLVQTQGNRSLWFSSHVMPWSKCLGMLLGKPAKSLGFVHAVFPKFSLYSHIFGSRRQQKQMINKEFAYEINKPNLRWLCEQALLKISCIASTSFPPNVVSDNFSKNRSAIKHNVLFLEAPLSLEISLCKGGFRSSNVTDKPLNFNCPFERWSSSRVETTARPRFKIGNFDAK